MNKLQEDKISKNSFDIPLKKASVFYLFFKRLFDFVTSLFALIILSPIFLILSIVLKLQDGGKVFYSQERVGQNGKIIKIHKFRSMVKNSHDFEDLLIPEQLEQYHKEFKIDDDPRVTKVGKFIRKTSLDEIPQIWDILVGRISVVGPRPLIEEEIELYYNDTKDILLSCKPGLTGYWQAYARNNANYETGERQKMELHYVANRSLWFDIKILFKTVIAVITRNGAK